MTSEAKRATNLALIGLCLMAWSVGLSVFYYLFFVPDPEIDCPLAGAQLIEDPFAVLSGTVLSAAQKEYAIQSKNSAELESYFYMNEDGDLVKQ